MKAVQALISGTFFLLALSSFGALSEKITGNIITAPAYLIDGDPAAQRSGLETNLQVTVTRTDAGDPVINHEYRVVYQLISKDGTLQILKSGATSEASDFINLSLSTIGSVSDTITIQPDPLATLNPQNLYQIVARLERREKAGFPWIDLGNAPVISNPEQVLHFDSQSPNDADFNVRGILRNLSWQKKFALQSNNSGQNSFQVEVDTLFGRYDDWDSPPSDSGTKITYHFTLREADTNTPVPLANNGEFIVIWKPNSYTPGATPAPVFANFTPTFDLVPLAQLKSATETYRLQLLISHTEDPNGNNLTDGIDQTSSTGLLHFNGKLVWNSGIPTKTVNTTFDELANSPTYDLNTGSGVVTTIQIAEDAGLILTAPEFVFGSETDLEVILLDSGTLLHSSSAGSGSEAVILADQSGVPIDRTIDNLCLTYDSVSLSSAGLTTTSIDIKLPQGLLLIDPLVSKSRGIESLSHGGPVSLTESLDLHGDVTIGFSTPREVVDESHPLRFTADDVTLTNSGQLIFGNVSNQEHIHGPSFDTLALDDLADNIDEVNIQGDDLAARASNDSYLRNPLSTFNDQVIATAAADQSSRLSVAMDIASATFQSHFPAYAEITRSKAGISQFVLIDGSPSASTLSNIESVNVGYRQSCPDDPCSSALPRAATTGEPPFEQIHLVPGGGLFAEIQYSAALPLSWGGRGDGNFPPALHPDHPYAHRTSAFDGGKFYMPGYQLYAADNDLPTTAPFSEEGYESAPAALLLSGFNSDPGSPEIHLPTAPEYLTGDASWPGLNYAVDFPGLEGASRLGGSPNDFIYFLQDAGASRYYVRDAGVFGRQVAIPPSDPSNLQIYGYDFGFDSYQLAFKASENTDSWTDGQVEVSGYSNFSQSFKGLTLTCIGELNEAEIDTDDLGPKALTHWTSDFIPSASAISFSKTLTSPEGDCPAEYTAYLTMGGKTKAGKINNDLNGIFAFTSNGNFLNQVTGADVGIDCEVAIPPNLRLDGLGEDYSLVTYGKLRFSNPEANGLPVNDISGFVTYGATVNVPYFKDLRTQIITSAVSSEADVDDATVYLTPGWEEDGKTILDPAFDPEHVSWPAGNPDLPLAEYLSPDSDTDSQYLVKAEQSFFGILPVSYPLRWDPVVGKFESMKAEKEDLFVIAADHQIDHLDATVSKVSFGAKFEGLPSFNLVDLLNSHVGNFSDIMGNALTPELKLALDKGFGDFDDLLANSLDRVLAPVIDDIETQVLHQFYNQLHAEYQTARTNGLTWPQFQTQLRNLVTEFLSNPAPGAGDTTSLHARLQLLGDSSNDLNDPTSLVNQVQARIRSIIIAIDTLANQLEVSNGDPLFNPDLTTLAGNLEPGLLHQQNGDYPIVDTLVDQILRNMIESEELRLVITALLDDITSDFNADLNALIEDYKPALIELRESLNQVRAFLVAFEADFTAVGGFVEQFANLVFLANSEFTEISTSTGGFTSNYLGDLALQNRFDNLTPLDQLPDLFADFSRDAFIHQLKTRIKDSLIGSNLMRQFKHLTHQSLYDIRTRFSTTVNSTLRSINQITTEVLATATSQATGVITPFLGTVRDYVGAADITGFAEFNGDSLRKLRLDGGLQLKIPDELKLQAYLEVNAYQSVQNSACTDPGDDTVEVIIGADDIGIDWIRDNIRADLGLKMSLVNSVPHSVGGSFDQTSGTINFQTFEVKDLRTTMGIGGSECYFGGAGTGRFGSYEVSPKVFFGRTCSAEPLIFVDPQAGELFNTSTFPLTGTYVFGDAWIPISENVLGIPASCLFNISGNIGAGVGFFMDDSFSPSFVGKLKAGLSGEALCVVSIKGTVSMAGIVERGSFRASGTGRISGKAGVCPFCVKFSESVTLTFDNGSWGVSY